MTAEAKTPTKTAPNRFETAVQAAKPALGTICTLDGFATNQLIAMAGADFVLLDKQHCAYDWSQLETFCWRTRSTGAAIFIRTASVDPAEVNLVLDLPVDGVMLPNISSFEEARKALLMSRSPPRGERSVGNVRTSRLLGRDFRDPEQPRVGLLIEHIGAVNAIEQICTLEPDFFMVGPHDLAASMGLDTNTEPHRPKELREAFARVHSAAFKAGVGVWEWIPTSDVATLTPDTPHQAILWSIDTLIVEDAFRAGFTAMGNALKAKNGSRR